MGLVSGINKIIARIKTASGYQKLSFWTSAETVEMNDGNTLQSAIDALDVNMKNQVFLGDPNGEQMTAPNIDATTLNGHKDDYFAKKNDLDLTNKNLTSLSSNLAKITPKIVAKGLEVEIAANTRTNAHFSYDAELLGYTLVIPYAVDSKSGYIQGTINSSNNKYCSLLFHNITNTAVTNTVILYFLVFG